MKKLAIIGAGDLGQLIAHHTINDVNYELVGYFDDTIDLGVEINNLKVIGRLHDIESFFDNNIFDCLIVGIGYNHIHFRKLIFEKYVNDIPFASVIHPSSYVDSSCIIGSGVFILPGCILDKDVVIKDNVLLNTGCVIAHDTEVGEHSFLSPSVKVAGKTKIGMSCVLGINSTVIDNIILGEGVKLGGGTVVIKNLIEPGLYVGVPAIFKKKLI